MEQGLFIQGNGKMNYRIMISGSKIYKEISMKNLEDSALTLGTDKKCKLRFQRKNFFEDFLVAFSYIKEQWVMEALSNVYFVKNEMTKEHVCTIKPGDKIGIYYEKTNHAFLYIDVYADFGRTLCEFDAAMRVETLKSFTIGGDAGCTIQIQDKLAETEYIQANKVNDGFIVKINKSKYGILKNGSLIKEQEAFIKDYDFLSVVGYMFYFQNGILYTSSQYPISGKLQIQKSTNEKNHFKYPRFIRNARRIFLFPKEEIEILPPKSEEKPQKRNLIKMFLPMVVTFLLMIIFRGVLGGGGYFVFYFAGTMVLSSAMSIWGYVDSRKEEREKASRREKTYHQYILGQQKKIEKIRNKEYKIATIMNMSVEEGVRFVEEFHQRLFEKSIEDEDFLTVYLGKGTTESECQIKYKQQEYVETDDLLMTYPEKIHEKYRYMIGMPITISLKQVDAVGIVGTRTKLYQMAKNMMISVVTSHFYQDVNVFLAINEQDIPYFQWVRWLPHVYNEQNGIRNIMYNEESTKLELEYLYAELSRRNNLEGKQIEECSHVVVFVYRMDMIQNHPVLKYIEGAGKKNFSFVFFEEHPEMLPKSCGEEIILQENSNSGILRNVKNAELMQTFEYPHIPKEQVEKMALRLAGVYVDEVSLESALTKNITLFELLHIMTPYDLDLQKRWEDSRVYESMEAPLGVKSGGEIVSLNIHEKFHGPHGLVAGTTGSGKSEIMQSYILSLSTLFHPYEVGFLLIDFKGGGMANQFKDLPHLIGAITNIDGKEINRSLLSIRAELQKRQELFSEYGVNHIDDYIKLYKNHTAKEPLPHLILIVDEFAELKSEQPEFMKELISTARIGRSLGIHLILATQKPAGVVNEQIWSNSRFKLCLKVQDKADSNEVLKSPLAAEIREPGRAYLQVGNNEVFQLFQSAYSGAPFGNNGIDMQRKFCISKVHLSGKREIIYKQEPQIKESNETQLDALVNYIKEYCMQHNIERLPNICLPPLPSVIDYKEIKYTKEHSDICIPFALLDNPSKQIQMVTDINITQNHVFIVGAGQMGKTNVLQTVVRGIAENYDSEEVNIYILDFASHIMKNFEELKHVGGVIVPGNDEKVKSFFKMITQMIADRKDILSNLGLSSYSAYREAGYREFPQVVILLDNLIAFRSVYNNFDEELQNISREGIAVGISLVVTATQSGGMGFRLISNFSKRIALYCNDSSDYTNLFERCKMKIESIPGRCIVEINREQFECQSYLAYTAEKEIEKIHQIRSFILKINSDNLGRKAQTIPEIPDVVTDEYFQEQSAFTKGNKYNIPLGINYENTEPIWMPLLETNLLAISGRPQMGRTNYVCYLINKLEINHVNDPVEIYILDDYERKLSKFKENETVLYYGNSSRDVEIVTDRIKEKVKKRQQNVEADSAEQRIVIPLIVIILNDKTAIDTISKNKDMLKIYQEVINGYSKLKMCVLLTNIENSMIGFQAPELLKMAKNNHHMLLFHNIGEQKLIDVTMGFAREYKKEIVSGEAFYQKGSKTVKVKTVLNTLEREQK